MDLDAIYTCVHQLQLCSFFLGICVMLLVFLVLLFLVKKEKDKKLKEASERLGLHMNEINAILGEASPSSVFPSSVSSSDKNIVR